MVSVHTDLRQAPLTGLVSLALSPPESLKVEALFLSVKEEMEVLRVRHTQRTPVCKG